jgi:transposase
MRYDIDNLDRYYLDSIRKPLCEARRKAYLSENGFAKCHRSPRRCALYEQGYHNDHEGGLLPSSQTPVEETQEVPAQEEEEEEDAMRWQRPRASDRALIDAIWYVLWSGCQWKAVHRDWFGVSSSLIHERFPKLEEDGRLREADEADGRVLGQRAGWDRLEVASDGFQELRGPFGRRENRQEPN